MQRRISAETLEPTTLKMYEWGRQASAAKRLMVSCEIHALTRQLGEFFESYDILLTPVLAKETPELGSQFTLMHEDLSLDDWFENALALMPYTALNNMTGTPAISLPLGKDPNGLPLGAHFIGPVGREDRLLNLAGQLERQAPWADQRPGVHVAAD